MRPIKVAIPLKTNSVRVPNKNLRPFFGNKSLFDVKMEQLLEVFSPSDVYVSSEDVHVGEICSGYGVNFLLRDPALTSNNAPWFEVVKDIVGKIPSDSDIMWVQVTQPLFKDFDIVLEHWREEYDNIDSLAVVRRITHHILDEKAHPLNFEFGYWHRISQDLPKYYEVTWACFCMKREMVDQTGYQIGRRPYLFETTEPLVDIDTETDFKVAGILYAHYSKTSSHRKRTTA